MEIQATQLTLHFQSGAHSGKAEAIADAFADMMNRSVGMAGFDSEGLIRSLFPSHRAEPATPALPASDTMDAMDTLDDPMTINGDIGSSTDDADMADMADDDSAADDMPSSQQAAAGMTEDQQGQAQAVQPEPGMNSSLVKSDLMSLVPQALEEGGALSGQTLKVAPNMVTATKWTISGDPSGTDLPPLMTVLAGLTAMKSVSSSDLKQGTTMTSPVTGAATPTAGILPAASAPLTPAQTANAASNPATMTNPAMPELMLSSPALPTPAAASAPAATATAQNANVAMPAPAMTPTADGAIVNNQNPLQQNSTQPAANTAMAGNEAAMQDDAEALVRAATSDAGALANKSVAGTGVKAQPGASDPNVAMNAAAVANRPAAAAPQPAAAMPAAMTAAATSAMPADPLSSTANPMAASDSALSTSAGGEDPLRAIARASSPATAPGRPTLPPNHPVFQVALHMTKAAQEGVNRFTLRMDPPELGRIDVRMDLSTDSKVSAMVVVERQETLDMLQRDARSLERALSEAGLDTDEDGLNFMLQQEQDQAFGDNDADTAPSEDMTDLAAMDDEADDLAAMDDADDVDDELTATDDQLVSLLGSEAAASGQLDSLLDIRI